MNKQLIKPLPKGQITIPVGMRKQLDIDEQTYFFAKIVDDGILLKPVRSDWQEKYLREFSESEIHDFIKDDKLDKKTTDKFKKYLS